MDNHFGSLHWYIFMIALLIIRKVWMALINFLCRLASCFLQLGHRADPVFFKSAMISLIHLIMSSFLSNLTMIILSLLFVWVVQVLFIDYLFKRWAIVNNFVHSVSSENCWSGSCESFIISCFICAKSWNSFIWGSTLFTAQHVCIDDICWTTAYWWFKFFLLFLWRSLDLFLS